MHLTSLKSAQTLYALHCRPSHSKLIYTLNFLKKSSGRQIFYNVQAIFKPQELFLKQSP